LEHEPAFLHDATRRRVVEPCDADHALEPDLLKSEPEALARSFGGQPSAPELRQELEADLPFVSLRPVVKQIQTDPPDPAAGRPLNHRPRAKSVLFPHAKRAIGDLANLVWRDWPSAGDELHRRAVRANGGELTKVGFTPRP
jgi:hypothetical protein